jgi:hypothetical protein
VRKDVSSKPLTAGRKPATTPVRGARRQSTGHAQKSQRGTRTTHTPATAPGRLKSTISPGHERVPKLKTLPPARTAVPLSPSPKDSTTLPTLPTRANGKLAG